MALDPSIFAGQLRPPRGVAEYAGDFADLDAKRAAAQSNALQRAFAQAKFDEYGRQVGEANALRAFQRSLAGKSESDVLKAYRDAGFFNEAGAMEKEMLGREKQRTDITKETAAATKAFGEAQADAIKRYRGALDYIDTPAGAARWLQAQYADPLLAPHMQALGPVDQAIAKIPTDPQGFSQWRQLAGLGMEKFTETQLASMRDAESERANRAREAGIRRGQDITVRGQDQPVFLPVEGVGVFVGDKRTGTARPVTTDGGKPVVPVKALTEGQAKANLFGTRMQEADAIITKLAAEGVNAPSLPQQMTGGQGITGRIATAMANPKQQQVDQAQRNFINAALRRESGAVISPEEFANARLQYFVQPGDSPEVIAQKAQNRRTAIRGLLAEVPEGRRGLPATEEEAAAAPAGAPAAPGGMPSPDAIAAELARRAKQPQGAR